MQDDFQTREWADARHHFTATVNKLIRSIAVALAVLHRRQFDAPWKHEALLPRAVQGPHCG